MARAESSSLHLQTTAVSQQHGEFPARYSGPNSLSNGADQQTSETLTIFAGRRLWKGGEVYVNPELAGGSGFNKTQGIAGFPNGEIYRVDDPSPKWNLARLYVKQAFGFGGGEQELIKDDKNQIATSLDKERLTIVAGKFALNDVFDNNSYSHDPRTQFLNWALMDGGAWDYAADTRGYSWGLYLEWNEPTWAVRIASVLVPKQANQMELDTNFPAARADNVEFEWRYAPAGIARIMAYENHANMGHYRTTIESPAMNIDVTKSRTASVKYGVGLNLEHALSDDAGVFARASWNDGRTETWAFTEIDQSLSVGASVKGRRWNRPEDSAGAAVVINGLSEDHRDYLAGGGLGFVIGDGTLNYAPEEIGEIYYLWKAMSGLDVSGDVQYVQNPAYNADRGPATIFSVRVHAEI